MTLSAVDTQTREIPDNEAAVDAALKVARAEFKTGKTLPYKFRVDQLRKLVGGMQRLQTDLSAAMTKDLGRDAFCNWLFELHLCVRDALHTIDHLHEWMKDECVDTPFMIGPGKSYIVNEPLGVVGILSSWNYPVLTAIMPLIAAIGAGNCAVLKPSEMSTNTSLKLKHLVVRNLDSKCYKVVEGQVKVAIRMTNSLFD